MDPTQFDRCAKTLAAAGTRRALVRLLAALPLGVTLTIGLGDAPDATADSGDHGSSHRRQRRRARRDAGLDQEKRKGKAKRKGKPRRRKPAGCTPESAAQTCAGKCAQVPNNCGAVINCGPCACTPTSCPICQTCDASTRTCLPASCPVCQTCDAAGQCVADGAREGHGCGAGLVCQGGTCGCLRSTANLQAAITVAAAGATLTLCPGTWNLTSTIAIAQNLTLVGAGVGQSILDGGNAVQVLKIDRDVTVTVQDLTITKGRATGSFFPEDVGGGIFNAGTLTLVGVSVSVNTAGSGAIYNANFGTLTLQDSRVMGNTANHSGGGIYTLGTVTLQAGSSVMNNTATKNGGGIYNEHGTVTLQADSSVSGNTSVLGGGIVNRGGTLTLQAGSSVTGNTALFGGGILNDQQQQGTVTLEPGSSVTGNSLDNCDPNIGSCI
jgi:predicted outer membrane repeat protein